MTECGGKAMKDLCTVILKAIHSRKKEPLLIAIDGRCAAGKTTLADKIKKETDCNVIHMDHFFLQSNQRTEERLETPGGNVDYERFLEEVMLPFRSGQPFSYRIFDCKSMDFVSEVFVKPNAVTIVEGSYSCHPALWDFYDFRIFLDIEPEEQLCRIRRRNGEEALAVFRDRWIPLEERYFSAYRIQERCDFSFRN